MVLLKDFDMRGFVFYTNIESQKGRELDESGKAALLFHWKSSNRQVRLRGPVEQPLAGEAPERHHDGRLDQVELGAEVGAASVDLVGARSTAGSPAPA